MKSANIPSGATRTSEVGLWWVEVLSNATGSVEVPPQSCVRVRAVASGTVTIDGVLAATLDQYEVMLFNVGQGNPEDTKRTVTVTVSADSYVQVGQEVDRMLVDNN